MRKTLQDVAGYLKEIMVPEAQGAYAVGPAYTGALTAEDIRQGVLALRAFLVRLYDVLIAGGEAYDKSMKAAHAYENRTTLSVYYPFLHNVNGMLIRIGSHGVPAENAQALACGNDIFNDKLSAAKNLACLRFLMDCGIRVHGIDAHDKRQSLRDSMAITVTYPDDPAMLAGLKAMATAEKNHRTLANQDVLLRCDYRALKSGEADVTSIVRDTIRHLPENVQAFVLHLHQRHLAKGLPCVVEVKGFHICIKHCHKRRDVWGINASLNNGYHINVKAASTDAYAGTVQTFSPALQALIAKGYGCGRKRAIGQCDGGCRGIPIPLDDTVLGLRDDIVTWLDQEALAYTQ